MTNMHPPIVRKFEIKKLHGYKNIVIDFEDPIKIVIAENGAGKTTILTALYSFLRADFITLRGIQFDEISCLLMGLDTPLILSKSDIDKSIPPNEFFQEITRKHGIDEHSFYTYLLQEFNNKANEEFRSNPIIHSIYINSPYAWEELLNKCIELRNFFFESLSDNARNASETLKKRLSGYEILYLPTYRRIEKAQKKSNKNPNSVQLKKHQNAYSINYGLSDVEQRLKEISEDIQRKSNFGYRQISAQIIENLISDSPTDAHKKALPDIETMKIFFSRINNSSLMEEKNLERINQIYLNPESTEAGNLRYFLGMLADVVNQTSQLEKLIETFVAKVNSYLGASSDSKKLIYDQLEMKVFVLNEWTQKIVDFDDLSSGEKQVISILSYLFLHDTPKIVLIDEPELSLSIEWQRRILPDIVSTPLCCQLLAITHSPFIFDNELDPYGSMLNIERASTES